MEHKLVAARDEAIATEEGELAISSQMKSEEMLSESASEEFESMADREVAESEMTEADRLLKQSVKHGVLSLGFALQAVLAAGLVVYGVVMRGMTKIVIPGLTNIWNSRREYPSSLIAMHSLERLCDVLMHFGIVVGSILSMPKLLTTFSDAAGHSRVRGLIILAVLAGGIESLLIHATYTMISCRIEGRSVGSTVAMTIKAFFSSAAHLVPAVIMELLMIVVICGQGFFGKVLHMNPAWIWFGLVLLLVLKLIMTHVRPELNVNPNNVGEYEALQPGDVHLNIMEYGAIEDVGQHDHVENMSCTSALIKTVCTYFERLRRWSDLLVLIIMVALLWHCWPAHTVLDPFIKQFEGVVTDWVPLPYLVVATIAVAIIFHVLFVY